MSSAKPYHLCLYQRLCIKYKPSNGDNRYNGSCNNDTMWLALLVIAGKNLPIKPAIIYRTDDKLL